MSDLIGLRLVKTICKEKDLVILSKKGISEDDLFDVAKTALVWVKDHVLTKGGFPPLHSIEETCKCKFPEEDDTLEYISENIRKRSLANKLESRLRSAIARIEDRNPDEALSILTDAAMTLKGSSSAPTLTSYKKSGVERFNAYKLSKERAGLVGIPTLWPKLDSCLQGWVNGCFHVVAAMSNTGKSWLLCACANDAEVTHKKRVLFGTLEMSAGRIARRLDCLRYKIPFGEMRDGEIDSITESVWKEKLEKLGVEESSSDILIADKKLIKTVYDVMALVQQNKPDIVFIDGGYRFAAQRSGSDWEKQVETVRALQICAEESNIPWVVTTQFGDSNETGKEKKRGKKVRAWNTRYGKEWFIDPDVLIGMYQDDDTRLIKQMEIHPLKVRDADEAYEEFNINWDMNKMDFTQIGSEEGFSLKEEAGKEHEITY